MRSHEERVHKMVKKYYSEITNKKGGELASSVCCCASHCVPDHIKAIATELPEEIIARYYRCGSPIPNQKEILLLWFFREILMTQKTSILFIVLTMGCAISTGCTLEDPCNLCYDTEYINKRYSESKLVKSWKCSRDSNNNSGPQETTYPNDELCIVNECKPNSGRDTSNTNDCVCNDSHYYDEITDICLPKNAEHCGSNGEINCNDNPQNPLILTYRCGQDAQNNPESEYICLVEKCSSNAIQDNDNKSCKCKDGYYMDSDICLPKTATNCGKDGKEDCTKNIGNDGIITATCDINGECSYTCDESNYNYNNTTGKCEPICKDILTQFGEEKIGPGLCGCYLDDPPEEFKDSNCPCGTNWNDETIHKDDDGDGIINCLDICPTNHTKSQSWDYPEKFVKSSQFDINELETAFSNIYNIPKSNFSPYTVFALAQHPQSPVSDEVKDVVMSLSDYCDAYDWNHNGMDNTIDQHDTSCAADTDTAENIHICHAKDLDKLNTLGTVTTIEFDNDINLDDYGVTQYDEDHDISGSTFLSSIPEEAAFPVDEMTKCTIKDLPVIQLKHVTMNGKGHTIRAYRGKDNSNNPLHRCSLTHALFDTISDSEIVDLNLDFDVLDIDNNSTSTAMLANKVSDSEQASTFTNVTYSGTIVSDIDKTGTAVGGLIANIDNSDSRQLPEFRNVKPNGIEIYAPNSTYTGGMAGKSTIINYLGVVNTNTSLKFNTIIGGCSTGGLIGYYDLKGTNGSSITNLKVETNLISGERYVGGLIGFNKTNYRLNLSNIHNKSNEIRLLNNNNIICSSEDGTNSNSYAAGGIIGYSTHGHLNFNYIVNTVQKITSSSSASNDSAGGILGYLHNGTMSISNVLNHINEIRSGIVGGVIGAYTPWGGENVFSKIISTSDRLFGTITSSGFIGELHNYYSQFSGASFEGQNIFTLSNLESGEYTSGFIAKCPDKSGYLFSLRKFNNIVVASSNLKAKSANYGVLSSNKLYVNDDIYWYKTSDDDQIWLNASEQDKLKNSFSDNDINGLRDALNQGKIYDPSINLCPECTVDNLDSTCANGDSWEECFDDDDYSNCSKEEVCLACATRYINKCDGKTSIDPITSWEIGEFELYDDKGELRKVKLPVLTIHGLSFDD